jgi:hypothetical protein
LSSVTRPPAEKKHRKMAERREGKKSKLSSHNVTENDEINYEIISIVTVIAFAGQIFVSLEWNLTELFQEHF